MINSIEDIKKFINDTGFKKIFVLCGKKSFVTSGAEIFFKELLNNKVTRLFYKNSELPVLEELIKIIDDIKTSFVKIQIQIIIESLQESQDHSNNNYYYTFNKTI